MPCVDVGQIPTSPRDRLGISCVPSRLLHLLDVVTNSRILSKIKIDKFLTLHPSQISLPSNTHRTQPVDHSKVQYLGDPALIGRNILNPVHRTSRRIMDIFTPVEGFEQPRLLRQVRQNPQLDLRVVSSKELPTVSSIRNERLSHLPTKLGTNRNVLDVRISAGKSTRRRPDLVEARVNALGLRIHQQRQGIDISRLQLAKFAELQHGIGYLVDAIVKSTRLPDFLQCIGVHRPAGLGLASLGCPQFVDQKRGHLLVRSQVKLSSTDHSSSSLLDLLYIGTQLLRHLSERRLIDHHTVPLHFDDHRQQRQLDLLIHISCLMYIDLRLEILLQPPREISVGCGIRTHLVDRHCRHRDLLFSDPD